MKNYTLLFTAIALFFSLGCFSQNDDAVVVAYRVTEKINTGFGSQETTYEVSSLSLISDRDLGPNNTRTITPRYAKRTGKLAAIIPAAAAATTTIDKPIVAAAPAKVIPVEEKKYVSIDIMGTYERVIDKGYQSVPMLTKIGDARYFDGDLIVAAKWYGQLFELTTDLDAVYFYRYAQCLKAIDQPIKAGEMMKLFDSKTQQEKTKTTVKL
jgi:hypothetical protein